MKFYFTYVTSILSGVLVFVSGCEEILDEPQFDESLLSSDSSGSKIKNLSLHTTEQRAIQYLEILDENLVKNVKTALLHKLSSQTLCLHVSMPSALSRKIPTIGKKGRYEAFLKNYEIRRVNDLQNEADIVFRETEDFEFWIRPLSRLDDGLDEIIGIVWLPTGPIIVEGYLFNKNLSKYYIQ